MRQQFENLEFKNEPDETTPLSAENLNQLQTNIENALKDKFDFDASSVSNANNVSDAGIYLVTINAQNFPFNTNTIINSGNLPWLIVLLASGLKPTYQIATETGSGDFWVRKSNEEEESGWSEWKQITKPKRNIFTITRERADFNVSTAWSPLKIEFTNSTSSSDDGRLIFENGSITIGKNVNKILASSHVGGVNRGGGGDKILQLYKNNNNNLIAESYVSGANPANWQFLSISPTLIDVEEGDVIYVGLQCGLVQNVELLSSYMTIEVID